MTEDLGKWIEEAICFYEEKSVRRQHEEGAYHLGYLHALWDVRHFLEEGGVLQSDEDIEVSIPTPRRGKADSRTRRKSNWNDGTASKKPRC